MKQIATVLCSIFTSTALAQTAELHKTGDAPAQETSIQNLEFIVPSGCGAVFQSPAIATPLQTSRFHDSQPTNGVLWVSSKNLISARQAKACWLCASNPSSGALSLPQASRKPDCSAEGSLLLQLTLLPNVSRVFEEGLNSNPDRADRHCRQIRFPITDTTAGAISMHLQQYCPAFRIPASSPVRG